MRREDGQGTLDYLAVVLLVALVIGAAAAVVVGSGLGEKVVAAFKQGLCVVTGTSCEEPPLRACVRASSRRTSGMVIDVAFVRLGEREVEMREYFADGSVAYTVIDDVEAGLVTRVGLEVHVRWGSFSMAYGDELRAAILAQSSHGRTWVRASDAEADEVADQVTLERRSHRAKGKVEGAPGMTPGPRETRAPPAQIVFSERGGGAQAVIALGDHASVSLSGRRAYGERVNVATGERTVYVRNVVGGTGSVALGGYAGEASGRSDERYGITFDRFGRPRELVVLSAIDVDGSVRLPTALRHAARQAGVPLHGARHIETEQHLDLADPANAAVVERFLGASPGSGAIASAGQALRGLLDQRGSINLRSYTTDSNAHEVGVHVPGFGGESGREEESARLDTAYVRGPGGEWMPDPACEPSAPAAPAAAT